MKRSTTGKGRARKGREGLVLDRASSYLSLMIPTGDAFWIKGPSAFMSMILNL